MRSHPKVSIIMSVYNGELYLRQAIESVLSQTFADFEFIIVDDGSTDGSNTILMSYKDDRIRLFHNANQGQLKSLNEAIGHSVGEYIAILDADDISHPERFEKQVDILDLDQSLAMCGSFADFIDKDGKHIGQYQVPISSKEIRREVFFHCPFIHSSMMIRREILDQVGYYNESFSPAHDYELWTRIIYKFATYNIPEYLISYRIHSGQTTTKSRMRMRGKSLLIRMLSIYRSMIRV